MSPADTRASLFWAHRWSATSVHLRVRSPDGGRLLLVGDDTVPEIDLGALEAGTTDVVVDVAEALAQLPHPAGDRPLVVRTSEGSLLHLAGTRRAARTLGALYLDIDGHAALVRLRAPEGEPAQLTVTPAPPWGEVSAMDRDGERVRVTGHIVGEPGAITGAALQERDGDGRLPLTLERSGSDFVLDVDLAVIPPADSECHWNVVLVSDAGDLRVAGHLDDVYNKGRAVVPRPSVVRESDTWWLATPRFTDHNNVVITLTEPATGSGPPDPRERWEVDPQELTDQETAPVGVVRKPGPVLRGLRRIAIVAFGVLARLRSAARETPDDAPRDVHFLIASIHATGGTIRATINTANTLAADERNRVGLTVVYRIRKQQYFDVDPKVRTRILVNERSSQRDGRGPRQWLRGLMLRIPSALIPRDDPRYYRFSLLHDVQLYRWLRSVDSGVIITTRAGLSTVAARFTRAGVHVIAQQHVPFSLQPPKLREQLAADYRRLDAVTVLTHADEEALERAIGAGPLIRRIPNGLYDVEPPRSPLDQPRILCGGRMTPVKGIDLMVESFARIATQRPEWELRIYGSARADRLEAIREMVRQHGLEERVLLMAPSERLELEMSKASVCAVPSRHEAFGMMIIEAMRCGLPVVAFDCPTGPREIITDGVNGVLVPPEDVSAFAEELLRVTGDADLRRQLADAGFATSARYTATAMARRWSGLFDELGL